MSKNEHWFSELNIGDGLRLMRAFTKMTAADQTAFIKMAEDRAGTVENFMESIKKPRSKAGIPLHGGK